MRTDIPEPILALAREVRAVLAQRDADAAQPPVAKATPSQMRQTHIAVMAKAMNLQAEGKITAFDVAKLQALRLLIDASLDEA